MALSVFDLFTIGVGPSSSHTVGPMRAALAFAKDVPGVVDRIQVDLYGSLALTGVGHGTDRAIVVGLEGDTPEGVDPARLATRLAEVQKSGSLLFLSKAPVHFSLIFHKDKFLPYHSNAMKLAAFAGQKELFRDTYYSIGGGFILNHAQTQMKATPLEEVALPFAFETAADLFDACKAAGLSLPALIRANERAMRSDAEIDAQLDCIWDAMRLCIDNGCQHTGLLPGGLKVRRRASKLYQDLLIKEPLNRLSHSGMLDWVSLYALAVNEENAAGGRVVTAPTNGASGIIPAVLKYYTVFCENVSSQSIRDFLLVAGAIGILYKKNASLSAAEVGCQGEVGVACSMAAGALACVMGGSLDQIENAAEIGMEHNLGLTCDPVGGLVQIPCIERNTMGALKAINAARLALHGDGQHHVSLDQVIRTMKQTGKDMQSIYKETSLGGLAVNVPNC